MKSRFRLKLIPAIFITIFIILTGCSTKINSNTSDILTQKIPDKDKIPVTVLVKYAFSINTFEKEAEKRFPKLDIIQVGNYSSNMGKAEYEARLKNDDLTDIVMTWPLEIGQEYWEDRFIDLSSMPFTSDYNVAMMDAISQDGKLYYLPGPSQIRGLVYNKTLFAEKGWTVPKDFNEFVDLCKKIEASGIRSLQLSLGNSEVLETPLVGFGYADSYSKPQEAQLLREYNEDKKGSFKDFGDQALNTYQVLIDNSILKKEDLNLYYQDREKMLFSRECAMAEDSVLLTRMGFEKNGCTDEFGLMPFFNPNNGGDWARLYPICYIGLNKHLEESQNKEKYDLIMDLMNYISTSEGQVALSSDTGGMLSSLNGIPPADIPEIKDLLPAIEQGRYGVFPTLTNAQSALQEGLTGMIKGELTKEDVIKGTDTQNANPPTVAPPLVIGTATEDFSLIETGNFLTDAMRKSSDCEIALFIDNGKDGKFNGKGLSGRLYNGEQTTVDVSRILPDLKHQEKGELLRITMTGEDLIKTLEYSIPVDNNINGWFYYFSGLKMDYAPSAEPGSRIKKITDGNDQPIDPQKIYSIAVMDKTVPEELMQSCDKTGLLISDILTNAIKDEDTISPSDDGRFVISEP